jgi:hypothetical protein
MATKMQSLRKTHAIGGKKPSKHCETHCHICKTALATKMQSLRKTHAIGGKNHQNIVKPTATAAKPLSIQRKRCKVHLFWNTIVVSTTKSSKFRVGTTAQAHKYDEEAELNKINCWFLPIRIITHANKPMLQSSNLVLLLNSHLT